MLITNQRFALLREGDTGGTGGTPPPAPPAAPPPAPPEPERKYTQEELNRIDAETKRKTREATQRELLEALGVKSTDELKASLDSLKKIQDAAKTDLEKAQGEAADWKAKAEKAQTDAELALATANERLLKSAVLLEAGKQNVDDAELASVWLVLQADKGMREKVKQNDAGDFEGVAEAVKEIVKAHPKWLKGTTAPRVPGTPPARGQQPPPKPAAGTDDRPRRVSAEF